MKYTVHSKCKLLYSNTKYPVLGINSCNVDSNVKCVVHNIAYCTV